ncbi:MAG TPA: hypothetical protein VFG11_07255 [Acidobacteriota bacterium]|nr:hypothetical protein [Acidobacteriota bacterium]
MPEDKTGFLGYLFQFIVGGTIGGLIGFGMYARSGVPNSVEGLFDYVVGGVLIGAALLIFSKATLISDEGGSESWGSFVDFWQKSRLATPIALILCLAVGVHFNASVNIWLMPVLFIVFQLFLQTILP